MRINEVKNNFENRNIEFEYYESEEQLLFSLKEEIGKYETIGIGNSITLKHFKISELAQEMNKTVYDKTKGQSKIEKVQIKKKALLSECYITSSNAITEDGKLINVDHSGNRVAAMTYGPDRVLVVVGINKLTVNEREGISRALNVATPMNAERAKIESPCSLGKTCDQCNKDVRVCNYLSIIRGQNETHRMKVFLVDEELGY